MGKYADMESDEHRLPEGFTRTGYDADTEQYHYTDEHGREWVGAPGCRYGELQRVGAAPKLKINRRRRKMFDDGDDEDYDDDYYADYDVEAAERNAEIMAHERESCRNLSSFLVLVGLVLLVTFWLTRAHPGRSQGGAHGHDGNGKEGDSEPIKACGDGYRAYAVQSGDSCWSIAQDFEADVDAIVRGNEGLNCDKLLAGEVICVPDTKEGEERVG